jgi:ketosteroid isomerase-like protein
MKTFKLKLALSCLAFLIMAATFKALAQQDSIKVKNIVTAERKGWADLNLEEATRYYADDIYWINAWGIEKRGKAQVREFVTKIFANTGYNSIKFEKPSEIIGLKVYSNDLIWVHTYSEASGQKNQMANYCPIARHIYFTWSQEETMTGRSFRSR